MKIQEHIKNMRTDLEGHAYLIHGKDLLKGMVINYVRKLIWGLYTLS